MLKSQLSNWTVNIAGKCNKIPGILKRRQVFYCTSNDPISCDPSLLACCNRPFMLGLNQQIMYFFIAGFGEILVPEANTVEWLRRLCTNDFVYLCLELATG